MPFTKHEVGQLRPSQVLTTFGVGSIIDLPNIAAMVMGLDDWPIQYSSEISEERLLASVQNALGGQVKKLLTPPRAEETASTPNAFDERAYVGVPVAPFPRWMVCPSCQLLAPLSSGLFTLKTQAYRPDRARYVHANCQNTRGKPPSVVPARFIVACKHGHLDDFPWVKFVHQGKACQGNPRLRLREGISGEAADVLVFCEVCTTYRSMASAFGPFNEQNLPACRGRRPHLRDYEPDGCDVDHVRAMLQGASNSWFAVILSALSIPTAADQLSQLVDENWVTLEKAQSEQNIELLRQVGQLNDFAKFTDQQIWEAVQKKRAGGAQQAGEPTDLKSPEWEIFTNPTAVPPNRYFKLRPVQPPANYRAIFNKIVLVERLREVRALIGFTRIESPGDYDTPFEIPDDQLAPLSRIDPKWVPSSEVNGEGIFFELSEDTIKAWEKNLDDHNGLFYEAHQRWREARSHPQPKSGYPSIRYILLHSLAHAVIRQLAVECGYTTASIRERIYSRREDEGPPMAGILIYTAAPDSEGTLGGLVSLGETDTLGRHLDQALEAMRLCASDPLCAEHHPFRDGTTLHGAACHACLFLPETSCERGNKYLDRSVLVGTMDKSDLAFFIENGGAVDAADG
ncbi:MAG: DrmB family protein [Pirellulales bacterium]